MDVDNTALRLRRINRGVLLGRDHLIHTDRIKSACVACILDGVGWR
jgi:hypothetical protein